MINTSKNTKPTPNLPDPLSCGIVNANLVSNAPAINAPLPSREQPVTAKRPVLICAAGVISNVSMMREAPQTQAVMALAETLP